MSRSPWRPRASRITPCCSPTSIYRSSASRFTVKQETIDNERDKLKAFLIAEIKGWRDAIADPAESARLAAEVYGKDQHLDVAEQTRGGEGSDRSRRLQRHQGQRPVHHDPRTSIDENIAALKTAKLDIAAADLFDLSIIDEIYKEHPDLKA